MGKTSRIAWMGALALSAGAALAAQIDPQGTEAKKYVAFGMEYAYMTPQDFLDNVDQFLATPLDGVGIQLNGGKGTPRAYQCFRNVLAAPAWTHEQLQDMVAPLRKMSEYPCFKENFIWAYYPPPKRLDWRDDAAWSIASNNLRAIAWLAREGHQRGISFDIEDYTKQKQMFRIPSDPPYDELVKIVRRRGRDIASGIYAEFPDITIFQFWILSDMPYRYGERDLVALARERGDLWPAFVNGMLDTLPPTATLVDGSEDGYKYEAVRHDYHGDYLRIFNWDLPLIAPENRTKYLTQVSPSFGQYLDMYINPNNIHWYAAPYGGSRLRHLARNVREATSSAKKYVWFWSEKGRWTPWSERYWNDPERLNRHARCNWQERIPGGFYETLKAIKDPEGYLIPALEKAIAAGEMQDLLGNQSASPKSPVWQSFDVESGAGDVYYVTGEIRAEKCTSGITYLGKDRFGLFGPRELFMPGKPGKDGWRHLAQFVTVPETAARMSIALLDECRDMQFYNVSASSAWRKPMKLKSPQNAFEADCTKLAGWMFDPYLHHLAATVAEVQDEPAIRISRATKDSDTAWKLTSAAFAVTPGMDLEVSARIISPAPGTGGRMGKDYFTGVVWLDASGAVLKEPAVFGLPGGEKFFRTHVRRVHVPEGAVRARIRLGYDSPSFKPDAFFAISRLKARLVKPGMPGWDDPAFDATVPGRIELVTSSPCENVKEAIRFKIVAPRGVDWASVRVTLDGTQKPLDELNRNGIVLYLAPPNGAWPNHTTHRIFVSGRDGDGNRLEDEQIFAIGSRMTGHLTTIRADGTVLLDGVPFFPIGFYGCSIKEADGNWNFEKPLADVKSIGCNTAMAYRPRSGDAGVYDLGRFLEAADRLGMKTFIEPGYVRGEFDFADLVYLRKHHPSLLGWLIGDDTASHQSVYQVSRNARSVKACDNAHLTMQTDSEIFHNFGIHRYLPYAGLTDVFQPQLYPVEQAEITSREVPEVIEMMKAYAEDAATVKGGRVSCWPIVQAFMETGEKSGWKRYPTAQELRAFVYAAIVHGAKGMLFYTYRPGGRYHGARTTDETWARVAAVTKELAQLQEDLVCPDSGMQPKVTILEGPAKDCLGYPSVSVLMKSRREKNLVIAVNSSTQRVKARIDREGFCAVERVFENGAVKASNGFTDDFEPIAVHLYRVK